MNTSQLECCIKCDEILTARVIGIFALDRIPNVPIHYGLIVNTDKSTTPGQHWYAIFDGHGHVEFFDSYGRPPEENSVHILKWIRETAKTWNFNQKQLQSNYSTVCGLHCLLYLRFKCLGGTMEEFTSLFDNSDFFVNDSFVYDMSFAIFSDCVKPDCTRNQSCCALDGVVNK